MFIQFKNIRIISEKKKLIQDNIKIVDKCSLISQLVNNAYCKI